MALWATWKMRPTDRQLHDFQQGRERLGNNTLFELRKASVLPNSCSYKAISDQRTRLCLETKPNV
jgi:hypothetical protein